MVFISSNPAYSPHNEDDSFCVGIDAISSVRVPRSGIVLPPIESDDFVSQRHEVNPALALNLLGDIQMKVSVWQQQQRRIVQAMRMLYAQGPMVDGWLQSSLQSMPESTASDSASATLLRHGDTDALMQYVEVLERSSEASESNGVSNAGADGQSVSQPVGQSALCSSGAISQYCLCVLSDDGQVRSQPCPPEQMAMVSTAIARYQKFKQLTTQKQLIEAKLQQAVDSLTGLRATLQQD